MAELEFQTPEQLRIIELEKKLAVLESATKKEKFSIKVSDKGCICFYLLGRRWPISMYESEFLTISSHTDDIMKFLADNKDLIRAKEKLGKETRDKSN